MSNEYQDKIESLFNERCFSLSTDQIMTLNNTINNGECNNVIVGLSKHFFGLIVNDNPGDKNYELVYINGTPTLEGHIIRLNIDDEERDSVTFFFARYLAFHHPVLNVIDTFNTFQTQCRAFIEKLDYITIDSNTFDKYDKPVFAVPNKKGIYRITILDKVSFYKSFFEENKLRTPHDNEKHIYLMLNIRNNHFKIGSSKNARYREKTLQAQEPEVKLITYWCGPVSVEKDLHKHFHENRVRGEWFKLSFADLQILQTLMSVY
jgi:hypothetical protein